MPIILSNIKLNENVSSVTEVSYAVFVLSLIALLCFINIIFYILSYILLTKGNYENKYPKLKFIINYYKNTSLVYITIEILFCFICLLILVVFSLLLILK